MHNWYVTTSFDIVYGQQFLLMLCAMIVFATAAASCVHRWFVIEPVVTHIAFFVLFCKGRANMATRLDESLTGFCSSTSNKLFFKKSSKTISNLPLSEILFFSMRRLPLRCSPFWQLARCSACSTLPSKCKGYLRSRNFSEKLSLEIF